MADLSIKLKTQADSASFNSSIKKLEAQASPIKLRIEASTGVSGLVGKSAKESAAIFEQFRKASIAAEDFQVKLNNLKTTGGLTQEQFNNFNDKLSGLRKNLSSGKISLEDFSDEMHNLKNQVSEASTSTKSMGQSVTDIIGKFTKWYLISGLVTGVIGLLKQMVSEVINLDKAMVELSKVFDGTEEDLQKVKDRAFEIGEELGRTGEEVIKATTEFKRMGYTIDESLNLARVATMMTNVAEGITDTGEAAQILTSILKGTGVSAEYAQSLLDRLNKVSNENAVSFDALAHMLQESAATMHILGNNTDETIGLLTGAFAVLQDERVGKGLQTIGLRIAGLNENMEAEAGLANEVSEALMKYAGIDVFDKQTGQLKSTYAIMEELAGVWDTLSKNEQSVLLNQLAGKQRADVAAALLTNWEEVSKAVKDASDSMGSATEEQSKYVDSIEGRLNQLKNIFQKIADDVIGSDLIKVVLDLVKSISSLVAPVLRIVSALFQLTGLTERLQRLGTVIEWIGKIIDGISWVIEKIVEGIKWVWQKLTDNKFVNSIKNLFGKIGIKVESLFGKDTKKDIDDAADSYKDLAETFDNSTKEVDKYAEALSQLKKDLSNLSKETQNYLDDLDAQNERQNREKELNEKLLSIEKARQELAEAKQKRVRVFRAGIGFAYETDVSEVQSAQENLHEAVDALTEYKYDLVLERTKDFVNKYNEILSSDDMLVGWKDLFDEFGDLLDTEFADYYKKAKEFIQNFDTTVAGLGSQSDIPHNAGGTRNWQGGLTTTDEHGWEMKSLPKGTEILSHQNSVRLSSIADNPAKYFSNATRGQTVLQFNGPLNFPNVRTAEDASGFIDGIITIGNSRVPKYS